MNNNIKLLIDTLESLLSTIERATFNKIPFDQQHGWNQVYLDQKDVANFIKNLINKLNSYSSKISRMVFPRPLKVTSTI